VLRPQLPRDPGHGVIVHDDYRALGDLDQPALLVFVEIDVPVRERLWERADRLGEEGMEALRTSAPPPSERSAAYGS